MRQTGPLRRAVVLWAIVLLSPCLASASGLTDAFEDNPQIRNAVEAGNEAAAKGASVRGATGAMALGFSD